VSMQITVKEHEFDEVVSGPTQAINIDKMWDPELKCCVYQRECFPLSEFNKCS
jgi:hypothetical protein